MKTPNTPDVETFSATDKHGLPVRFTISTDIVDYMESAETFGREQLADPGAHGRFARRMVALPDRKSAVVTPLVLTLSSQNGLYLVRQEEGSESGSGGWSLTDLGGAFNDSSGSARRVRAFGVGWTADDRITVAVAVDDSPSQRSRVFVAYNLSSRATGWNNIAWQDCGVREDIRVEGVSVLDNGDGQWTIVLAGDRGPNDMLYLLGSTSTQRFDQATVFNPAVTLEEILDFQVVRHPTLGGGIAVLGTNGGTRDVSFRPFPTEDIPIPSVVPLPCPDGANVLATGWIRRVGKTGALFATDLFIGGQGIQLIPADQLYNQSAAKMIEVASPATAPDVQDVLVAEAPDGSASMWALLQNGRLIVVKRAAGAQDAWGTPLRLRSDVQEVAPAQGNEHATTHILLIYTDGKAASIWQDRQTGVWNEAPLLVANPNQVAKVTCFGTSLRYLDQDGIPQYKKKVSVSASVLASVVLNGKAVFIGPTLPVQAETDANGGIHVYDRVRSLTPAVYRFTLDDIDESFDVTPAAGAHKRFQEITADELRNATVSLPGGRTEPLLGPGFAAGGQNASQVEGVAVALNRVSKLVTSSTSAVVPGVTRVPSSDSPFSSTLQNSSLPAGYRVGIKATDSGLQMLDSATTAALLKSTSSGVQFFMDLGDSIADFFEGLAHRIQKGWEFVVHKLEDGWRFVCKIGDSIKDFVLDTLEQIGGFFTWLWDQIKTSLEKLWEFLKFLFDWDDILAARNVMVRAVDETLRYLQSSTEKLKGNADTGFRFAIDQIRQWQTEIGEPPAQIPHPAPGTSVSDQLKSPSAAQQHLHDQILGNSVIGWVMQKLDAAMSEIVQVQMEDPSKEEQQAISDFSAYLIGDEMDALANACAQIQADVLQIFGKKMPGNDSLSFETLKSVFIRVGADVVIALLETSRNLALRSIDVLDKMIEVARKALFARISFPFVERLIEVALPGRHVDTSFRLIDAIMLLVSIPATIAYKLIFGRAPFELGHIPNLGLGRVTVQSGPDLAFTSYFGLAGGFLKLAVAGIKTFYARKAKATGVASSNKWFVPLGLAFSVIGLVGEVLGAHDPEKEHKGDEIGSLEASGALVLCFCVNVSVRTATARWNAEVGAAETDAVATLGGNIAMLGLGASVYAILIDQLRKFDEKDRQATESCRWVGRTLDQIANILFASAVLVEELATKYTLCGFGTSLKAAACCSSILEVIWPS